MPILREAVSRVPTQLTAACDGVAQACGALAVGLRKVIDAQHTLAGRAEDQARQIAALARQIAALDSRTRALNSRTP
jgi:hypothetical protein